MMIPEEEEEEGGKEGRKDSVATEKPRPTPRKSVNKMDVIGVTDGRECIAPSMEVVDASGSGVY
eukprot:evm.model.NODE_44415_length_16654_cov_16.755074.2